MQIHTLPVVSGKQLSHRGRTGPQSGNRTSFGQQQATCSHHTHHAGCSHAHHAHKKPSSPKEAPKNVFQKVGQWITRFYRSLLDDLGAFFRFLKAKFGFKQPDSTTAAPHTHSEHCHHPH